MRIRLKKGVALIGAIAGAAIATALIVYNVNNGNAVNTSDMEALGLLDGLESAFEGNGETTAQQSAVVADSQGVDAAVAAGTLGTAFGDQPDVKDTAEQVPAQAEENINKEESAESGADEVAAQDAGLSSGAENGAYVATVQEDVQTAADVQSYVEVVPQTRTETVVSERYVTVETPVTVTEMVSEEVEADPVYFQDKSEAAAASELTTTLRAEEAKKAYDADMERLKAAAQEAAESDHFEKMGDEAYGDSFVIFY